MYPQHPAALRRNANGVPIGQNEPVRFCTIEHKLHFCIFVRGDWPIPDASEHDVLDRAELHALYSKKRRVGLEAVVHSER